jgi:UDP-N-acetylmuramoylalanine--D-glutamate ligase
MKPDMKATRVVVLGMGVSGVAAAKLLRRHGYDVFVSEILTHSKVKTVVKELDREGIPYECGRHTPDCIQASEFVVKSPGIPPDAVPLKIAAENQIPVYSEIEVASWFCRAPIVAVTGTNGKTTTTTLIGQLLKIKYPGVMVGGNIGTPFADFADRLNPTDMAVLEVSSFQLENIKNFKPHIAVILNISPNHLDHHSSFSDYMTTKMRIIENQSHQNYVVYNADDPWVAKKIIKAHPTTIPFALNCSPADTRVFLQNGSFYWRNEGKTEKIISTDQLRLKGQHNFANILAACTVALILKIPAEATGAIISQFEPLEHRLEFVANVKHVQFYNDSKATSSMATINALQSFAEPVILLAGGKAKEEDYSLVLPEIRIHVKAVCLYGDSRKKLYMDLQPFRPIQQFSDLKEAFDHAVSIAQPGDVVLLSPMCASLDQYKDYQERGKHFKRLVGSYKKTHV